MKCFKVTFNDGTYAKCMFQDEASVKHYYRSFLDKQVISIEEITEKEVFNNKNKTHKKRSKIHTIKYVSKNK